MKAYHLICTKAYEIVTPASPVVYSDGTTGQTLPEFRCSRKAGERYVARRKAEAESMVRTGNWDWEPGTVRE